MGTTYKIDDIEFQESDLSEAGKGHLTALNFANARLAELNNLHAVLNRAQNSYIATLKQEIIAKRGGLLFDDD